MFMYIIGSDVVVGIVYFVYNYSVRTIRFKLATIILRGNTNYFFGKYFYFRYYLLFIKYNEP